MANLYTTCGQRKYLIQAETLRFVEAAGESPLPAHAFAWLLVVTGCRISEALQLTRFQLDWEQCAVTFRTLKQRNDRPPSFRTLPVPAVLMAMLHELAHAGDPALPVFTMSRATAFRHIKAIMRKAQIAGPHACPKGLRHSFGVTAMISGVHPSVLQRLMGHRKAASTAVYLDVLGEEQLLILQRIWRALGFAPTPSHPPTR